MAGSHLRAASIAAPLLKAAGFRRRRNEFQREEASGFVSVVGFYPDSPGFGWQYGMVTPALIAFRAGRGIAEPAWLSMSQALIWQVVFHPAWDETSASDLGPYRWRVPFSDEERFPSQFEELWKGQALPDLNTWASVPGLIERASRDPLGPGLFSLLPPERRRAIAWFEGGPSADLHAVLEALDPRDVVRVWIESELARKTTD